MAYAKDLWTHPVKQADGTVVRERSKRWGRGKRWMAGWLDPEGNERTKVFSTKVAAERHGAAMETDGARGEYIDPNAGKVRFEVVAERWLKSRVVDPASDQVRVVTAVACCAGLRAEAIEEYQAVGDCRLDR